MQNISRALFIHTGPANISRIAMTELMCTRTLLGEQQPARPDQFANESRFLRHVLIRCSVARQSPGFAQHDPYTT